jgi:hypothetical protein
MPPQSGQWTDASEVAHCASLGDKGATHTLTEVAREVTPYLWTGGSHSGGSRRMCGLADGGVL